MCVCICMYVYNNMFLTFKWLKLQLEQRAYKEEYGLQKHLLCSNTNKSGLAWEEHISKRYKDLQYL